MLRKVIQLCYSKWYEMRKYFITNFTLGYTMKQIQENEERMDLNETQKPLVYVIMFNYWVKRQINGRTKRMTLTLYEPIVTVIHNLYTKWNRITLTNFQGC